jgi:hypothetical protein
MSRKEGHNMTNKLNLDDTQQNDIAVEMGIAIIAMKNLHAERNTGVKNTIDRFLNRDKDLIEEPIAQIVKLQEDTLAGELINAKKKEDPNKEAGTVDANLPTRYFTEEIDKILKPLESSKSSEVVALAEEIKHQTVENVKGLLSLAIFKAKSQAKLPNVDEQQMKFLEGAMSEAPIIAMKPLGTGKEIGIEGDNLTITPEKSAAALAEGLKGVKHRLEKDGPASKSKQKGSSHHQDRAAAIKPAGQKQR